MALQSITRNGTVTRGKPRVYFACEEMDYKIFFTELSKEILDLHNCVIYYEDNWMDIDLERCEEEIQNMQLVVIPVSSQTLKLDNKVIRIVFPLAKKYKIPVIPILMENGIEQSFIVTLNSLGEEYAKIQYINRNSNDSSEVSYEEKLKKKMNSVFIGEELTERVRKAFDAYIFLSYRKKDRADARKLMELIHRIPGCWDIAIWYDEYLVPGESWYNGIIEALEKSNLVTLAITPNMLEKGNYVMEHEYPKIKETNKPVISALLKETNREELQKLFPEIPECIDGKSLEEMKEILKKLAFKKNDNSPEHNYLIGLAYLGGIDVERNPKIAEKTITYAANNGLLEAMEKLVHMYSEGEGVSADYHQVLYWQKKIIEKYKEKFECSKNYEDGKRLFLEILQLGTYYKDLMLLNEALQVTKELEQLAEQLYEIYPCFLPLSMKACAYNNMAEICRRLGNIEEGCEIIQKAIKIQNQIWDITQDKNIFSDLAISYEFLGDLEKTANHWDQAKECYLKSLEFNKNAESPQGITFLRSNYSMSLVKIGDCEMQLGNIEESIWYFEKALQIREDIFAESRSRDARRNVVLTIRRLGDAEFKRGNLEMAERYFINALPLYESIELRTADDKDVIRTLYYELFGILCIQRKEEARDYGNKAYQLCNELAVGEQKRKYQMMQSDIMERYGDLEHNLVNYELAEISYDRTIKILLDIRQETNDAWIQTTLLRVIEKAILVAENVKKEEKIYQLYTLRDAIHASLIAYFKDIKDYTAYADELAIEANNLQVAGNLDLSEDTYMLYRSVKGEVCRRSGVPDDYFQYSIGIFQLWQMNHDKYFIYLLEANENLLKLFQAFPDDIRYMEVMNAINKAFRENYIKDDPIF